MVDVVADEQSITLLSRHIFMGDVPESYVFYMFIDKDQAIMSVFLLIVLIFLFVIVIVFEGTVNNVEGIDSELERSLAP